MDEGEQRFYVVGRDVLDRERPGLIAGFGRRGHGMNPTTAAERLNAGLDSPEYYEWWVPKDRA